MPRSTINGTAIDLDGKEMILDADQDTTLTVDTDDRVDIKVAGSDTVHVTSTGLGIGTSSPASKLSLVSNGSGGDIHVKNGSGQNALIELAGNNNTIGSTSAIFGQVSDGTVNLFNRSNGNLVFGTNNTTAMTIDANGHITMSKQPAFLTYLGSATLDIAVNTNITVPFNNEVFDQNLDFDTSTYTFTAPVAGRYQLNLMLRLNNVDTAPSYYQVYVITSNRNYTFTFEPNFSSDVDYYSVTLANLADMDASDTAYARVYQSGGTQQTDISAGGDTYFSGFLAC